MELAESKREGSQARSMETCVVAEQKLGSDFVQLPGLSSHRVSGVVVVADDPAWPYAEGEGKDDTDSARQSAWWL